MSKDDIRLEAQLNQLNDIVSALEVGELSLDDALKQYEAGVKLVRACQEKLKQAQQKVDILKDSGLEPFDTNETT